MAPRKRTFAREEPVSLRRGGSAPVFTDEQMLVVSVFIAAASQGGYGVYAKLNNDGNAIRIKLYGDDDSYQDNVTNQDNLESMFGEYAKQLKFLAIYEHLISALWRAQATGQSGAPAELPVGKDTTPPSRKA